MKRWRATSSVSVIAVCLAGAIAMLWPSAGAPAARVLRPASTPVGVVQRYLNALTADDAEAVCATFSPALVRFLWYPGPTCARKVARSAAHGLAGTRLVRVSSVRLDHFGNLALRMVLWFNHHCPDDLGPDPRCHPGFRRRSDVVYLRRLDGRWLIVKPGAIYDDFNGDINAPDGYDPATAPGDARMLRLGMRLPRAPARCAAYGVSQPIKTASLLTGPGWPPRRVPFRRARWLQLKRIRLVRADQQICIQLTLAAAPQRDSEYDVEIDQAQNGGALTNDYGIDIAADGQVSAYLSDARRLKRLGRCAAAYGLRGDVLTLLVSTAASGILARRPIEAIPSTMSLQTGEPLIRRPLNANDEPPRELLHVPAAGTHSGSCVS
jgi:hypothetical protein